MKSLSIDKGRGRVALVVGHCAGMVDLVVLPLWIGVLIESYQFDPQQAGGLATLFFVGIVAASALLAPRFHRLPCRVVAFAGFGTAAANFLAVANTHDPLLVTCLHGICGLATGCGLSVTHAECVKTPSRTLAMISEDFIAGIAHGTLYPR